MLQKVLIVVALVLAIIALVLMLLADKQWKLALDAVALGVGCIAVALLL